MVWNPVFERGEHRLREACFASDSVTKSTAVKRIRRKAPVKRLKPLVREPSFWHDDGARSNAGLPGVVAQGRTPGRRFPGVGSRQVRILFQEGQVAAKTEVDIRRLSNFVGGEHVEPESGDYSDVIDPSTGEVYLKAPISGAADVDRAFESAAGGIPGLA